MGPAEIAQNTRYPLLGGVKRKSDKVEGMILSPLMEQDQLIGIHCQWRDEPCDPPREWYDGRV